MVYNIFTYHRPARVQSPCSEKGTVDCGRIDTSSHNGSTSHISQKSGIPDALSFDRIVSGGTCPPMTCRDFVKYMIYVEHGAENLQFFLWHKDYTERFEKLPESEKVLSPEYKHPTVVPEALVRPRLFGKGNSEKKAAAKIIETAFDMAEKEQNHSPQLAPPSPSWSNPFNTPPTTPDDASSKYGSQLTPFDSVVGTSIGNIDHKAVAMGAYQSANVKVQPFTVQPLRDEITRIISIYLSEGAPRELNISERDRLAVIKALAETTHPSAFHGVQKHIEECLRGQSHPNFIRWSIANGNRPRVVFARGLGVVTILAGLLLAILLTISNTNRSLRAIAIPLWLIGVATLWSAIKGMCVVLHGLHHYHVRPWELWNDDQDFEKAQESKLSFDSAERNSYEDEPWVSAYKSRFIIRKVFDRELWVQEPALRQIQDTIALQGLGIAAFVTGVLTAIFVSIPGGGANF